LSITDLAAIGLKAIDLFVATNERRETDHAFDEACKAWKFKNGISHGEEFIAKGSKEWKAMMRSANKPYQGRALAKRKERNAKDRLFRACRKANAEVVLAQISKGRRQ